MQNITHTSSPLHTHLLSSASVAASLGTATAALYASGLGDLIEYAPYAALALYAIRPIMTDLSVEFAYVSQIRTPEHVARITENLSQKFGFKTVPEIVYNNIQETILGTVPGAKRITLSKQAIKDLSDDELEFIIAHEMAHIVHRWSYGIYSTLLNTASVAGTIVAGYLALHMAAGVLPLAAGIAAIAGIFAVHNLAGSMLSKTFEFDADRRALEITNNPEAAKSVLHKIYEKELGPSLSHSGFAAILEKMLGSHPSFTARTQAIDAHSMREQPLAPAV